MTAMSQIVRPKNYRDGVNSKGLPRTVSEPKVGEALTDPTFKAACEVAGVEPTNRQASKYLNGHGSARRALNLQATEVFKLMAEKTGEEIIEEANNE